eukprot:GHVR01110593.1.p1 GENE.GHVR01110593.1~~GHVR01110593.1.p1  ORF type:complete len:201 (+),score=74.39 GHVR01110593.1:347-949(+)
MHTDAVETSVPSLSSRTPTPSLLDFFWLPLTHADTLNSHGQHVHPEYANLVVVTTRTIEIFRFSFQSSDLTKMKTLHSNSYVCWHESKSGVLVTAQGDTTLQPFLLASKQPLKLPVLVLDKQTNTHTHTHTHTRAFGLDDLAVVTLYEWTFVALMDAGRGTVQLRCVCGPRSSDIHIDIDVSSFAICKCVCVCGGGYVCG